MACGAHYAFLAGGDSAFTIDASRVTFGRGCLAEAGARAKALGLRRVGLFTDARVARLECYTKVRASLLGAGLDVVDYQEVRVEPTEASFLDAARFAAQANLDGYVSLGGGSVIDTCKAANLYATWPAPLLAYVNAPVGEGRPVPGPLKPHLACPTTSGTGSEVTGIAIFDYLAIQAKTGIAFGNAGVHAPHGMAYAVAGLVRDYCPSGYPKGEPLVPHGMSVIVNAPSVFRYTAEASPERHLEGAVLLGAGARGAAPADAGEVLAAHLISLMRATGMPNGLRGVGYGEADLESLTKGAVPQQRLLQNAPREMTAPILTGLFRGALAYW